MKAKEALAITYTTPNELDGWKAIGIENEKMAEIYTEIVRRAKYPNRFTYAKFKELDYLQVSKLVMFGYSVEYVPNFDWWVVSWATPDAR